MREWRSELGRALYYAYTDRDWTPDGEGDPPSWDELGPEERSRWRAVALRSSARAWSRCPLRSESCSGS